MTSDKGEPWLRGNPCPCLMTAACAARQLPVDRLCQRFACNCERASDSCVRTMSVLATLLARILARTLTMTSLSLTVSERFRMRASEMAISPRTLPTRTNRSQFNEPCHCSQAPPIPCDQRFASVLLTSSTYSLRLKFIIEKLGGNSEYKIRLLRPKAPSQPSVTIE